MSTSNILREQDKRALEECQQMVTSEGIANSVACIEGEKVFFLEHDRALMPGHIYSQDGINEFRISRSCEWHFDKWFATDEDLPEDRLPYERFKSELGSEEVQPEVPTET